MASQGGPERPCKVAILADSRGVGLKYELDHQNGGGYEIVVIVKKGRGIIDLVREVSKRLLWIAPDVIIIVAGICDITEKDRETGIVTLQSDSAETIVEQIEASMDTVRHHLSVSLVENRYKLIFGHIVGMDLARYNGQVDPHPQQDVLNDTITKANQLITAFNTENGVPTAWLAKEIHPNKIRSKLRVSSRLRV